MKAISLMVCCLALAGCRTVDYAYRHRVAGTVRDAAGKPVAGAVVERVWPESPGLKDESGLYRRTSAADGSFEFLYSGLGGKPLASDEWVLAAIHDHHGKAEVRIMLRWRPFSGTNDDFGYVTDGIRIVFPAGADKGR
jgi:hypothetical protein